MTFEDLHLYQQVYLVCQLAEGQLPFNQKDIVTNGYPVPNTDIVIDMVEGRRSLISQWLIYTTSANIPGGMSISFDVSSKGTHKLDMSLSKHNIPGDMGVTRWDRFGLTGMIPLVGQLKDCIDIMVVLLGPLETLDIVDKGTLFVLKKMLKAINDFRYFPSSFFEAFYVDVPGRVLIHKTESYMSYYVRSPDNKHRRFTPIITYLGDSIYEVTYEKPDTPKLKVAYGEFGSDVTFTMTSTSNLVETSTYTLIGDTDTTTTVKNLKEALEDMILDCSFTEEMEPLFKRFMQYHHKGIRTTCNVLRL